MSEIISNTCFYGSNSELEKVRKFMDDSGISYSDPHVWGNKFYADNISSFDDDYINYKIIAKAFPNVAFVGYDLATNCGEFGFVYSAKNSTSVVEVQPCSDDDGFDPFWDDDEEDNNEYKEPEEQEENNWYEEIERAMGPEAIKDLSYFYGGNIAELV